MVADRALNEVTGFGSAKCVHPRVPLHEAELDKVRGANRGSLIVVQGISQPIYWV
jgi:hypothetical protein